MSSMKFGFVIPGGDLETILDLAYRAEKAGWDGIFYWDGICVEQIPLMYDGWSVLAAIAMKTSKTR